MYYALIVTACQSRDFFNYQIPDIIMVPLIAFDNQNNRLGYGKGYYDLYLGKFLKK